MSDSEFESLLNKTGRVYRASQGNPNEYGERRIGLSSVLTTQLCLQPVREQFLIMKAGIQYQVNSVAYTPTISISEGDYLDVDSIRYLVVGVENESGQDHHLKLLLVKQ